MKMHSILALILMCAAGSAGTGAAQAQTTNADEIVATMLTHDHEREWSSGGYTGSREYMLENHLFNKRAKLIAHVSCDEMGVKHFEVVSEYGWKSASSRVLRPMIATEAESSKPDARALSRITSSNYSFRFIETSALDGRSAYVIEALPKRHDKNLFQGKIWIDAEDYALARVEGEPAKNPSFWTKKVEFVQQYRKAGPYWFPAQTTSVTNARLFGRIEVCIRYFEYKPISVAPRDSFDPNMMEAHYAKR